MSELHPDPVGFALHDHDTCISDAIGSAREKCSEAGLRLTKVRQRVLEILLQEHRALGAYDILDRLRSEGLGSQPPVAYRALDFLVANGFVHRVERLNAFIACTRTGKDHVPAFLICRECSSVAETPSAPIRRKLREVARDSGFAIETTTIEAVGLCPGCRPPS